MVKVLFICTKLDKFLFATGCSEMEVIYERNQDKDKENDPASHV